jgi:arginyl-tRNA synthetase
VLSSLFLTGGNVIDLVIAGALTRAGIALPVGRIVSKAKRLRDVDAVIDMRDFDLADRHGVGTQVVDALAEVELVADAAFADPFVTVRFDPARLRRLVCNEVLARGITYGSGDVGQGTCVHVQFSSPNLNKALHVGHLRNNLLGMALSRLIADQGHEVLRLEAPANHGRHISRAVVAYLLWSTTPDPEAAGMKPDHFVQSWYVRFNERRESLADDDPEARRLDDLVATVTRRLYEGDEALVPVWRALTEWAYDGIRATYRRIGTSFDVALREDESLAEAAAAARAGIGSACFQREDGSVYVEVGEGDDVRQATLLRGDGTPVLCAQYLGISLRRQALFPAFGLVNVMGREYVDRVPELVHTLRALGAERVADRHEVVFHAHVTLPEGRMRSRDGSSITADAALDATRAGMAERLRRRSNGALRTAVDDLAEPLSVALLKLHFLRRPIDRDVTWDERSLWRETFPRFLRMFEAYATVELRAWRGASDDTDDGDDAASCCTPLLVHIETFPDVARRAYDDRDPVHLVHFLESLGDHVTRSTCMSHRRAWQAVSVTMRRTHHLLALQVPRGYEVLGTFPIVPMATLP